MGIKKAFPLLLLFLTLGCNVYQNSGRKQFESAIKGNLQPGPIGLSVSQCWLQNKQDNFEKINSNDQLLIQQRDENHIEVCLVSENSPIQK